MNKDDYEPQNKYEKTFLGVFAYLANKYDIDVNLLRIPYIIIVIICSCLDFDFSNIIESILFFGYFIMKLFVVDDDE